MLATSVGILYALLAALGFALWNVYMQRALQRGASATACLVSLAASLAGIFLPVLLWQYGANQLPPLRSEGLLYFVLAGAATGTLAPFHSTQATRRIGAAQTTAIRLLDPFFAFVIGLLFLHERIAGPAIAGVCLIVLALWVLQRTQQSGGVPATSTAGLLFAIGASLFFTVGSTFRKAGLAVIPSPVVSVTIEGLSGLAVMLPAILFGRRWNEGRQAFDWRYRDIWLSGLSAALATLFLNMALQRLPLPVAVAVRNTSPWFALLLVPLLLGRQHKSGPLVWVSTLLLTGGMILILSR